MLTDYVLILNFPGRKQSPMVCHIYYVTLTWCLFFAKTPFFSTRAAPIHDDGLADLALQKDFCVFSMVITHLQMQDDYQMSFIWKVWICTHGEAVGV